MFLQFSPLLHLSAKQRFASWDVAPQQSSWVAGKGKAPFPRTHTGECPLSFGICLQSKMDPTDSRTLALHLLLAWWSSLLLLMQSYLHLVQQRRQMFQIQLLALRRRRRLVCGRRISRQARLNWFALAGVPVQHESWVQPRSADWGDNHVFSTWGDEQWLDTFRMTRQTFSELVEAIRGRLERQRTSMRAPIPVERRVAIALWYLANTNTYREVSDQFGVGVATAGEIVREVSCAIEMELYRKTVCLGNQVAKIMDGFASLGFPHCVGAIDGSRILIRSPGRMISDSGNRKSYSSILLQGTVDHTGRFIDAEVGWGDEVHNAQVFRCSSLCRAMDSRVFVPGNPMLHLEGIAVPALMIADATYPMRLWLMTPYGSLGDGRERNFDDALSRARNVVVQAFGRLKARWRCLSARITLFPENITSLVKACVVLHNICEERGHEAPEESLSVRRVPPRTHLRVDPNQDESPDDNQHLPEGMAVREVIANYLMANQGA